jgi:hypothetical protein
MSKKEIGLWLVMADFVALTAYAIFTEGYLAFVGVAIEFATSNIWGAQILADFLVAMTIALGWCIADARRRDLAWWPFAALTLTLGAIGPLSYLIHRERVERAAETPATAPAALQQAA